MTREEYMERLREQLEKFGQELQQEILNDYGEHFAEGKAAGKTDEEIIKELGNIEDMIRELRTVEAEAVREEEDRGAAGDAAGPAQPDGEGGAEQSGDTGRESCRAVVLKSGVADIVLTQSEDERIHVDYHNDGSAEEQLKYEFYQHERDGVFYAGVRKNKNYNDGKQKSFSFGPTTITFRNTFNIGARNENIELIARVPKTLTEVKLETSSGNIVIDRLALQKIKGTTASGDLKLSKAVLEKLEVITASGDISLEESTAERQELTTASGDIRIAGSKSCSAKLATASGDIFCRNMISEKIDAATASGDIDLGADAGEYHLTTVSGDVILHTDSAPAKIDASAVSGDMTLTSRVEGAEVKVTNRTGDIAIRYKGNPMEAKSGMVYTFGDGSCKVSAHSVSGDVAITL